MKKKKKKKIQNFKQKHINGLIKLNKVYNNKIPLNELFNYEQKYINSNSWFNINESNIFRKNNLLKFSKKNKKQKIIKCKKIIILPSDD